MAKVVISQAEFSFLLGLKMSLASSGIGIESWEVSGEERDEVGTDNMSVPRNASDALLVRMAKKHVKQRTYEGVRCECDAEEDIDGKTGDGSGEPRWYPDMSPTGPASVFGKVTLELARRLEEEVRGDEWIMQETAQADLRRPERLRELWEQWGWIQPQEAGNEQG